MKQVSDRELRQHFSAIAAAQAKWEANPNAGASDFRAVLNSTRQQIAAWESDGVYLSSDIRRLLSEVDTREACITQAWQQATRGY
jgi:hypothetical protein